MFTTYLVKQKGGEAPSNFTKILLHMLYLQKFDFIPSTYLSTRSIIWHFHKHSEPNVRKEISDQHGSENNLWSLLRKANMMSTSWLTWIFAQTLSYSSTARTDNLQMVLSFYGQLTHGPIIQHDTKSKNPVDIMVRSADVLVRSTVCMCVYLCVCLHMDTYFFHHYPLTSHPPP